MQVWTSLSTYPTTKKFVQTFFLEKVWLQNTLPTYSLDICPKFRSFFIWDPLLSLESKIIHNTFVIKFDYVKHLIVIFT